jgi:spore coat protein U-like protein
MIPSMHVRRTRWLRIALLLVGSTLLAQGASASASRCALVSVTGVSFGTYSPRDRTPLDSMGAIAIECEAVGPTDMVSIELGRSAHGFQRSMSASDRRLDYNLYLDVGRTLIWGDGTGGTGVFRGRAVAGRAISIPVYGRIPPRQSVASGGLSDQIVVTLQY